VWQVPLLSDVAGCRSACLRYHFDACGYGRRATNAVGNSHATHVLPLAHRLDRPVLCVTSAPCPQPVSCPQVVPFIARLLHYWTMNVDVGRGAYQNYNRVKKSPIPGATPELAVTLESLGFTWLRSVSCPAGPIPEAVTNLFRYS
jgi:hypothetical protein